MSEYETDFAVWSDHQSELLRRIAAGERLNDRVDWENVAEEIGSLGRSERRELRNRIKIILQHLILLQISPATDPRIGWQETVSEQRDQAQVVLDDSPSLRSAVPNLIVAMLPSARRSALASLAAHREQPQIDPASLTFPVEQVLG